MTAAPNRWSRRQWLAGDHSGFTLIEIGLVLLIMAVVLSLTIPRLRDRSRSELESHVRRLAVTIRFLRHEAILNGRTYRLNYDLDEQRYWITSAEASGLGDFERETGFLAREVTLAPPIAISDITLPLVTGKLYEGLVFTHFYPDGYVDLTVVHLDNGKEAYTLRADPLTGRVYVTAGYQDFDFSA